ncbi:MAG: aconitate hydratase AcnA [Planctomycetia bacterium]|nr:aconitate hydratase AcnA [Planctomycetia bacterium]
MTDALSSRDYFKSLSTLTVGGKRYGYYRLLALEERGLTTLSRLPYSIRALLEATLRNCDEFAVSRADVENLARWTATLDHSIEIPFKPARVILQDFTGVPAVVDLAAMRSAMQRLGGDPKKINPLIPVDIVVDHSVQTDYFGSNDALDLNVKREFERNGERYSLLRWAQRSLDNFRATPPSVGIIHQVNLEYLARVVATTSDSATRDAGFDALAFPDTVVGTDSHTVMINGLGVLGWGVGGIEAEAVMLGQPYYMLAPEVIGFELTGSLCAGVTGTDLALTIVQILRREGVVGKFVEYFGDGVDRLSTPDRAVLANMGPEYGATTGYFPIDAQTIEFLRETGRSEEQIALVEAYAQAQGLYRTSDSPVPEYTKTLKLDLSTVEPSLAGPKRPQDRVALSQMKNAFQASLRAPIQERGFALSDAEVAKTATVEWSGSDCPESPRLPKFGEETLEQGAVVIASITSCTNTSAPRLMIAAGLLAQKAVARGLKPKSYVKTSFGPGSRVVVDYLRKADLMAPLEALGFNVVGYGCLTCIGNSGPLPEPVAKAVRESDLVASAVLSGNRNFEGRVNPLVKANYLASPPLVVAFALAGTTNIDLTSEPVGFDSEGKPVMLSEIFPTNEEIDAIAKDALDAQVYAANYNNVFESNPLWNAIEAQPSELYQWDAQSSYIQEPPFLAEMTRDATEPAPIKGARALLLLGDSVTTDHISPAGAIKADSPAGKFLLHAGVAQRDFNSYGSRRGNDRVMTRGTFANIRIRNQIVPGSEGGVTKFFGANGHDGEVMSVYDAAVQYRAEHTPLVVLAGAEYGTGSSRDWAAKGTTLLGVRAVIASSFERIHRGNLVGMGVLPLEFLDGQSWKSLGLTGTELFDIPSIDRSFTPRGEITVTATSTDPATVGKVTTFKARVRIDAKVELEYYLNGGVLQTVLRQLLNQ